ncbi:MAG: FCD domain-containing protein [Solirubrobacterales bacterium]|nr:FCD domain-containing protein [Solirubrobacterales bacterium]
MSLRGRPARMANRQGNNSPGTELSLVDRVQRAVREAILSGEYEAGSRLLVSRLAQENGVSPIPVREALRRLESERLVEIAVNRGATVTPISVNDMRDIYETRLVIETYALRRAFPYFTVTLLDEAERILYGMTRLLADARDRQAHEQHRRFHFILYEPAHSAWTMHVIRQLWTGAERYLRLSPEMRSTPEAFAAEHAAILAAVREGDPTVAVSLLAEHLRRTETLLSNTAEGSTITPPGGDASRG